RNASLLWKSSKRQRNAMCSLRWQVWSRPPLFVANCSLFRQMRRSVQGSSGKRPLLAALAPSRRRPAPTEPCEDVMRIQISRRGKEYLETAQTLLRAARTMTDRAVAGQLKALADEYQRRAEKASHVDAAKALARAVAAQTEHEWYVS